MIVASETGSNAKLARKISRRSFLTANYQALAEDVEGATAAEYALLIALICSLISTGVSPIGQSIAGSFTNAANGLKSAPSTPSTPAPSTPPNGKNQPKKPAKKKKK